MNIMAFKGSPTRDTVTRRLRFDDSYDMVEYDRQDSPLNLGKGLSNGRIPVESDSESDQQTTLRFNIAFSIFLFMLVCLVLSFVPPSFWIVIGFTVTEKDGHLLLSWKEQKHIYIIGLLLCVGKSMLLALGCLGFSWNIIYYDSQEPGKNPPSPASPSKYRMDSGHTFHMGYSMCIINSAAVFIYALYWMRDHYT